MIGAAVRTIKPPEGIRLEPMPHDTTLEAMLERGEIDALASVMIPKALGTTMRRLFRRSAPGRARLLRKDAHFSDHAYLRAEDAALRGEPVARGQLLSRLLPGPRHRLLLDARHRCADRQPAVGDRRGRGNAENLRTADLGLLDRRQPADTGCAGPPSRRAKTHAPADEGRGTVCTRISAPASRNTCARREKTKAAASWRSASSHAPSAGACRGISPWLHRTRSGSPHSGSRALRSPSRCIQRRCHAY